MPSWTTSWRARAGLREVASTRRGGDFANTRRPGTKAGNHRPFALGY